MINKLQRITSILKTATLALLAVFLFNCNNDNGDEPTASNSTTKLFAVDGVGSDLKVVEVNPMTGNLESVLINFEPKQGRIYFDFSYLNTTNQLLIRENVYEGGIGPQLIKIEIDTKEQTIIDSESFTAIVAGKGKLYGLIGVYDMNNLISLDVVEINTADTSIISRMELFNNSDNTSQDIRTEISNILYSYDTDELLIPIRTSIDSNRVYELIKISTDLSSKTIIPIERYESMIVGRNGRTFAIKRKFDSDLNEITFSGVVEININDGNEIGVLKEFDNQRTILVPVINFLSQTNEVLIDVGTLYRIDIDTKAESILNNSSGFYNYRSVNIY